MTYETRPSAVRRAVVMAGSDGGSPCPQVAGRAEFGELVPVITLFVLWPIGWVRLGVQESAVFLPFIFASLFLGGWTLLMRLRFDRDYLRER